ncbi:transposase [Streptomyces microflavus]|uniref:transposase n=1 Tax=Streptomyces microflavus TaxID=1919 RepID=UPI00364CFD3B
MWTCSLKSVAGRKVGVGLSAGAGRLARANLRWRTRGYSRGPPALVGLKNGWPQAEWAGRRDPAGLQNLLNGARWGADAVRAHVGEQLGSGGVIIDDTVFVRKSTNWPGEGRQFTGASGKIGSRRIGLFAADAAGQGKSRVDRELYLPQSWAASRQPADPNETA